MSERESGKAGLSRRDALAGLIGGGLGALTPAAAEAGSAAPKAEAAPTQSEAPAEWSPSFLSAHQYETLQVIADQIVPGAGEAGVARTLDGLLRGDEPATQRDFVVSLSAFEGEALARYERSYIHLARDEQTAILDAAAEGEREQARGRVDWGWFAVPEKSEPPGGLGSHLARLKGWIARAYYSSEPGARELGWTGGPIHDGFPGCTHGGHG